jgi:hypothetical protein
MSISVFLTLSVTVVEWLALMISFSYRLTGSGWALAELSDETIGARIPASYLFSATLCEILSMRSRVSFQQKAPSASGKRNRAKCVGNSDVRATS